MTTPDAEREALLPCPFCGSSDVQRRYGEDTWPMIQCQDCGARGPCIKHNEDEAEKGWQARAASQTKYDKTTQGTHWEGCWRDHHQCAIAKIEASQPAQSRSQKLAEAGFTRRPTTLEIQLKGDSGQPAQEPVAWLDQDDAENALCFSGARDDKVILDKLKDRGIWLAHFGPAPPADTARADRIRKLARELEEASFQYGGCCAANHNYKETKPRVDAARAALEAEVRKG